MSAHAGLHSSQVIRRQGSRISSDVAALLDGMGNLFDDLQPKPLQGWDVHGRVGKQANTLDFQVGQNLTAQGRWLAESARCALVSPRGRATPGAGSGGPPRSPARCPEPQAFGSEGIRRDAVIDLKAARGVCEGKAPPRSPLPQSCAWTDPAPLCNGQSAANTSPAVATCMYPDQNRMAAGRPRGLHVVRQANASGPSERGTVVKAGQPGQSSPRTSAM